MLTNKRSFFVCSESVMYRSTKARAALNKEANMGFLCTVQEEGAKEGTEKRVHTVSGYVRVCITPTSSAAVSPSRCVLVL
jgi:hypothetical protein